jgi:hypothetical protein
MFTYFWTPDLDVKIALRGRFGIKRHDVHTSRVE